MSQRIHVTFEEVKIIQIQHADDEDDTDVVIGKKVIDLSRICEFMQTKNSIIFICVIIDHAMSECAITSALNGMDIIINTLVYKVTRCL